MVAVLATRVNRSGADTNFECAVTVAGRAGGLRGTGLCERKTHPEAPKQFDDGDTDQVEREDRQDRKDTGEINADKLDDGDEREAAHQAA